MEENLYLYGILKMRQNHRTWFKVIFNPILRIFGFSIVSIFDENDKLIEYKLRHYPKYCKVNKNSF